ncbi:porin [Aliiroseovarius halocynthiae]|nr:porin [Aliiroseovarius halocynthiae]SMR83512.1 porin [Aliiroseovarius halocynthiae]
MKKILFASTALVATAGVAAAADVDFSGAAKMGFKYDKSAADQWSTVAETTLSVAMTGETDGGLSFGAKFDITAGSSFDGSKNTENQEIIDKTIVYVEGGFGKFSVGEVDNAAQTVTGLSDIGLTGLGTDNVAETLRGASKANMLYEGTFGDFKAALSYNMVAGGNNDWAVGGKYTMGDYSAGLGYSKAAGVNAVHVQLGANVGDIALAGLYSSTTGSGAKIHDYGVTAAYTMGAVTVTAAYSDTNKALAAGELATEAYGLGVAYDLGGGASLQAGVGEIKGVTKADLGIKMSF